MVHFRRRRRLLPRARFGSTALTIRPHQACCLHRCQWRAWVRHCTPPRHHALATPPPKCRLTGPIMSHHPPPIDPTSFAPAIMKANKAANCTGTEQCWSAFPWMQPAIYSYAALELYRDLLDVNGLTRECGAFGVTHDVGLGITNWLLQVGQARPAPPTRHPQTSTAHPSSPTRESQPWPVPRSRPSYWGAAPALRAPAATRDCAAPS